MHFRSRSFFVAAILAASALFSADAELPEPVTSEYLRTTVASFSVARKTHEVAYIIVYEVIKPIEERLQIRVEFENPVDPKEPLQIKTYLEPGQSTLAVESPVLPGIQNRHTYTVSLCAYSEKSNTLVFTHEQRIVFIMPPGI